MFQLWDMEVSIVQPDSDTLRYTSTTCYTTYISPLVHVVQHGNTRNVKALLTTKPNINQHPDLQSKQSVWRLVEESVQSGDSDKLTRRILRQITNTVLQTATYREDVKMVQCLLGAGALLDTHEFGDTALQVAIKRTI